MASGPLLGVLWGLVATASKALYVREPLRRVGIAAPIRDRKYLELARLPLPLLARGNGLATTQLRPANGEMRQLHRRAQAREFGGSKLTKRYRLRIAVAHDVVSVLFFNRAA